MNKSTYNNVSELFKDDFKLNTEPFSFFFELTNKICDSSKQKTINNIVEEISSVKHHNTPNSKYFHFQHEVVSEFNTFENERILNLKNEILEILIKQKSNIPFNLEKSSIDLKFKSERGYSKWEFEYTLSSEIYRAYTIHDKSSAFVIYYFNENKLLQSGIQKEGNVKIVKI